MLKAVRDKADKAWTLTKKIVVAMSCWGLVFSLVTIGELRVAFDYDDTLVFSTPAFQKAFASGAQPFSPQFWTVVNTAYDLEQRKPLPFALAWIFRLFGFRVTILTPRPDHGGEALKKEWRYLTGDFFFTSGSDTKHKYLEEGHYVLYFGDSDSDITEGRKARVLTLRIKRSPKSTYRENYNPGTLRELVIPFTEY